MGEPFDVVLIDPPYAFSTADCERLLGDLTARGLVAVSYTHLDVYKRQGWSVNHANDSGTIEKNKTTNLDFVNTYALTPTTLATGSIKGEKVLANRDWQPGEERCV